MKNLNILTESFHEIGVKAEIKNKNKFSENKHDREVVQYMKYLEKKNNIKELLQDIKEAIKDVYDKATNPIEEQEEIEDVKNEIKKKLKNNEENIKPIETDEEKKKKKILEQKEEVKNAIILDNTIKLLKSLKTSLSNKEYQRIINNEKLLLEKVLRPDAILDEDEFLKYYTGINLEGINLSPTINLPRLDFDEINTISFLQMKYESPNFCSIHDEECDRRKFPDSCESRLEVENQGGCSSCWVFSGIHTIELSHCMASGKDTMYSRQEILDCSQRECRGGYLGNIAAYLHTYKRLAAEESYPYEAKKVYCRSHTKENAWTGNITEEYKYETSHILSRITHSNFTDDEWNTFIKKIVVKHGGVVVYLGSGDLRYIQGVPTYLCQTYYHVDHAVVIMGWKLLSGVPVWIIRNSWGKWWSDGGYAYVAITNTCQSNFFPIHKIHVGQLGDWSDKIANYKVINARTKEHKDKNLKSMGINIGEEKEITCLPDERLHIRKYHVITYISAVSSEKSCNQLDIKNKCENQQNCRIYFPMHVCEQDYKFLYVEYECLTGLAPFDCSLSKSTDSRISDSDCLSYCRTVASKCSRVTPECLYRTVGSFCNYDAIIKSEEEIEKFRKKKFSNEESVEDAERKRREEDAERERREEDAERERSDEDAERERREEDAERERREEDAERERREEDAERERREEDAERERREEDAERGRREEDAERGRRDEDAERGRRDEDAERERREVKQSKFDCTKAVAKLNSNKRETCIRQCGLYASNCSTIECLYDKISKDKCDLNDVFKGFDCDKTVAIENPENGPLCILYCKRYAKDCLTLDCLKEKVPQTHCDLTNVVAATDCDKAKALFIPDAHVSNLCVLHCQYYEKQCDTLECIYTKISREVCDLSKTLINGTF